jgi:carotenoid cleavage dioxygenase-like enzyme
MKDAKRSNQQVTLVRDRLYINNELYVPRTGVIPTDEDYYLSISIHVHKFDTDLSLMSQ